MLLSIICPMYNEEKCIEVFLSAITSVLKTIGDAYEIICINDGSTDDTLNSLIRKKVKFPELRIINLSRNFGKEPALTAGLQLSKGDVVIPIDADLQDPPEIIRALVAKYREGYDVVLARRIDRKSDSFVKRISATCFYRLLNKISNIDIPRDVGDCRLISRRVLDVINQLPENQRYMKGMFAWVGFSTGQVDYVRARRVIGDSRFNWWKLWNLALEGITSFSTAPLRIWTYIGVFVATISFIYGVWIVLKTLITGIDVPGYASLTTIVLFLGALQLIGIGIVGEYIGRIYMETKKRPTYIIESER